MNESKRQQKVSRQLQKDLSAILKKRIADNLRDALVTITRVQISPDLSVAKVYISTFSVQNDKLASLNAIDNLLGKFHKNSSITKFHLTSEKTQIEKLNHFNWAKKPDYVVSKIAAWKEASS